MAQRILVVEDDTRIQRALRLALDDEGYEVICADDAETGLALFDRSGVDVALIDLVLPGMSGFELCRRLRQRSGVPIIILTARADTHDVVAGLEAGADDYVTKPFVVKELAARIRSLLRRVESAVGPAEQYRFGELRIVPGAGTVDRAGRPVALTKTEFMLLCELAAHAGMVLSREQLLERVWGYDYFADSRIVDAHIRRLRTKIEDDPAEPTLVITLRGLGYRLEPP